MTKVSIETMVMNQENLGDNLNLMEKASAILNVLGKLPPSHPLIKKGVEVGYVMPKSFGSLLVGAGYGNSQTPANLANTQVDLKAGYLIYLSIQEGMGFMYNVMHNTICCATFEPNEDGTYGPNFMPCPVQAKDFLTRIKSPEFQKAFVFNLDQFEM